MNKSKLFEKYIDDYKTQIFDVLFPFWLRNGIDPENGGYFTCFNNRGSVLASRDKYVWSHGRFIAVLSQAAGLKYPAITDTEHRRYLDYAKLGVDFVIKNALLPDGICAFLLDETGNKKELYTGKGYDYGFHADCFVVIGLAQYVRQTGGKEVLDFTLKLYDTIVDRINRNIIKTEPYPLPKGYIAHRVYMVLLSTSLELSKTLEALGHEKHSKVAAVADRWSDIIFTHFVTGDDQVLEMALSDGSHPDNILGRYINPGHTIEDMWFVMEHAQRSNRTDIIERAVRIIKKAFKLGWDEEFGGLLYFLDKDGGRPQGSTEGLEGEVMVGKLQSDWDNKLWWTHTETIYSLLLGYELTGDEELLDMHSKIHDYTLKTFPNPDTGVGEWIQIRDRMGKPVDKVVALPVKDPFHILRCLMLSLELLYRKVS